MTATESPRVLVEFIDGVSIITFSEHDLVAEGAIHDISEQLTALADGLPSTDVLINFRGVRLMSSSVLAVLLKFARRMKARQGRLKLCGLAPDLFEVFRLTRFDRLFEIFAEEAAALDSF